VFFFFVKLKLIIKRIDFRLKMTVRVVQVTNIPTQCQKDQIRSLFAHLGRIDEIQLYPDSETLAASVGSKVAYIKYDKSEVAQAALQLTNTVFVDKPLLCSLVKSGKIPDDTEAVKFCAPLNPNITLIPGGATWPNTVINRVVGTGPNSTIETIDPALTERSLPQYPPLPGSMDPSKVEEIRRTVYVSNLTANISLENINDLFCQIGEIRFIRFAGDENAPTKSAYIEFSEQPYIVKALCLNGLFFGGKHIKLVSVL
jgi:arginine/serine-rich splicing factor 12